MEDAVYFPEQFLEAVPIGVTIEPVVWPQKQASLVADSIDWMRHQVYTETGNEFWEWKIHEDEASLVYAICGMASSKWDIIRSSDSHFMKEKLLELLRNFKPCSGGV